MEKVNQVPAKPTGTKNRVLLSSFARSRLRWDTINGSGPVSRQAFLRSHGTDTPHNHNWLFRNPLI